MALITTLRQKMGTVLVIVVGLAILSFVLTDLFSNNGAFGGATRPDNNVGEIAGEDVSRDLYQAELDRLKSEFQLQYGFSPTEQQMVSIRQTAWELMFTKIALAKQYDELGIVVTDEETRDMVQGPESNIDAQIIQAFSQDGQFNRAALNNYLSSIQNNPEQLAAWRSYEKTLVASRLRLKYENLLLKSDFATDLQAEQRYREQTATADVRYLYVPYSNISDSAVAKPTDAELRAYMQKHEEDYRNEEEFRNVVYVSFPIAPSAQDSAYYREDLESLKEPLRNSTNDSLFAMNNSDAVGSAFAVLKPANLPPALTTVDLEPGMVVGPVVNRGNGLLSLYKVSDVVEDTVASAKARHILIKWDDNTDAAKATARSKAQDIINQIRGGEDFAQMAKIHGTDGTAARGGDLGWFTEGQMVAEFQEAVFARSAPGLITSPVETQFGYHIIDVQETKSFTAYKIASIDREMIARTETTNEIYRQADNFRSDAGGMDTEGLRSKASELGRPVLEGNNLTGMSRSAGQLTDARELVRWAFRDAEPGDVSDVMEINDNYVVAMLVSIREKGPQSLENVRAEVTQKVIQEKKANMLSEQIKTAGDKSLDEIAQEIGGESAVYTNSSLKITNNSLSIAGNAPEAVGAAFGLKDGEKSGPIATANGVVVMEMVTLIDAPERGDYAVFKEQVQNNLSRNTAAFIGDALKDDATIVDERYKFY